MGEKMMMKKERKTPSQKKEAAAPAAEPKPWGGITKSWITSPSSACRIQQTWPQLVETNISAHHHPRTSNPLNSDIPFQFHVSNIYGKYLSELVVTGVSSPAFAFSKRNAKFYYNYRREWRMRDCRIVEPYSGDDRHMELTNVIGFQGKFYAISRQGSLVLIEDEGDSGCFEITALGRNRAVPYCKVYKHFREYLLDWEDEIYLVFLLSRKSVNVVDGVEVFRLDTSRLSWEKVDRLKGDAMFFVEDDKCKAIPASLTGRSKGSNCVYFTHDPEDDDSWFVYDMKTSCISVTSGAEIDDL